MYSNLYLAIIGLVFLFEQPAQLSTASIVGFHPFDRENAGYALHPLAKQVPLREKGKRKRVKNALFTENAKFWGPRLPISTRDPSLVNARCERYGAGFGPDQLRWTCL